ncbi:MAG: hypothetical protein L0H73_05750 [Nitrococcus sp.]|nr:hypothetical protein [Nitrococcus sp.]
MNADQRLLDALAEELARLNHELSHTTSWVNDIKAGKQSADLLKRGLTKRDVEYWARGASLARRKTRDRLAKVYAQFDASIHGR